MQKLVLLAAVVSVFVSACSQERPREKEGATSASLGVDLGFLLPEERLELLGTVPGADRLNPIVKVGGRALDWVDLIQKDVPPSEREQVWRRADRIGNEATPEKPSIYNPDTIAAQFAKAMAEAPAAVVKVLNGTEALPLRAPEGLTNKDVVDAIRPVYQAYSRASRWLALYEWKNALGKGRLDLRPWLKVRQDREALAALASRWNQLSREERQGFAATLAAACPLARSVSEESCLREYAAANGSGAQQALRDIFARGERVYNAKFGVLERAPSAKMQTSGGFSEIRLSTYGIDAATFDWIQLRVREAWNYASVGVTLVPVADYFKGAVKVIWEKGALPHVNGIAGDEITMDSNTPQWLEQTQTVMRHEMGHVLGFPDCYTEFWDEKLQSFTFYALDVDDAMCALSGLYTERHRDALLKGYF